MPHIVQNNDISIRDNGVQNRFRSELTGFVEAPQRTNLEVPANIRSYSESDIRRFVMDRDHEARHADAWTKLRDSYTDQRLAYEGKFKTEIGVPRWRTRLYVRLAFRMVETLKAFFDAAHFDTVPFIKVNPKNLQWKRNASNMQMIMQHEAELMRKRKKFNEIFNLVLKFGTGWTQNFWNFRKSFRPIRMFERDEQGNIVETGMKEQSYVQFDSPDFRAIDPIRIAPDPLNHVIGECRYFTEEEEVDFWDLFANRKFLGLFNMEDLAKDQRGDAMGASVGFGRDPFRDFDYTGTKREEEQLAGFDERRKRVRLTKYEGRMDMPGNERDPRWYEIWVANSKHVIKVRRSPYAFDATSYNAFNVIPQEDHLLGISPIDVILTDQRILNILTNTRLDSLHMILAPRFLAHKNSIEPGINSINSIPPGGFLNVKSMSDINRTVKAIEIPDQAFATWQQWYNFQTNHADTTMATNPNQGGALSPQRRSATEVIRALEGSNARFIHMVNNFIETGYYDHNKKEMMMIQQFMTQTNRLKITGDDRAGEFDQIINPWDVQGDFMLERVDPTKGNDQIESQTWISLLQAMAPFMQLTNLDPVPFLKGVLQASPLTKKMDLNRLFPNEFNPNQSEILNTENKRLEAALSRQDIPVGTPIGPAADELAQVLGGGGAAGGTLPGGAPPAGTPAIQPGFPQETAMGIAEAGL